jgi:[histone H3]-lysine4 N-trimethyltransferase ASH1L
MRNLRRVEKYHPALMAYYRNLNNKVEDDPKIGFSFVSKTHENSPPSASNSERKEDELAVEEDKKVEVPAEEVPSVVHQPLSEQSQVLFQICERLESSHSSQLKEIEIPKAPATGHSNHDRISLPVSFDDIKMNVKMGHYDLNPLLFHYHMKIFFDNVVKFWGVNCPPFHTMIAIRDAYKSIRTEMIEDIRRVWEDELLVNAMMDKIVKKPAKNRRKIPERHEDEDIVNCHCGRYLEEGVMIQCQKCLTWQHVDCAGTDGKAEDYCCIKCEPRTVTMDIVKKGETTADGHQCYLTLMRGNLQVRIICTFLRIIGN